MSVKNNIGKVELEINGQSLGGNVKVLLMTGWSDWTKEVSL